MEDRVLVMSASAGMGHVSAGDALADALRAEGAVCEHIDVLDLAPRWVARAYAGSFEFLAHRAPRIWRGVYAWADGPDADAARWAPLARRLLFRGMKRVLGSGRWQYCLTTHFLPAQLVAGRPGIPPFGLVVTDYALHRYWVQPRVRDAFVGTRTLAEEAGRRLAGVRPWVTGIPIRPVFGRAPRMAEARALLELPADRPIALVMGGGMGVGIEAMSHATLAADVPRLLAVALCGRADEARARLERSTTRHALRTVGFTGDVERWMAAADVIVTKPGGLSTTEALAVGRPLILTRPLPGHEEANVATLVAAGAALSVPEPSGVRAQVERVFRDPALRLALAANARRTGAPNAAHDVVRIVLDGLAERAVA